MTVEKMNEKKHILTPEEAKKKKEEVSSLFKEVDADKPMRIELKNMLLQVMEAEGLELDEKLQTLKDALDDFIDQEFGEAKNTLMEIRRKVERLLYPESEADRDALKRLDRDLETARMIEDFEKNKEPNEKLIKALERRNWKNIFDNLQKGDAVVSFLVPGADFLAIKNLNDKIFKNQQDTDTILAEKRKAVMEELAAAGISAEILQQDYKTDILKITGEADAAKLEEASRKIDIRMQNFITAKTEELMMRAEKENNAQWLEDLKNFKRELNGDDGKTREGFKMNYGISKVSGDSLGEKLRALNEANQVCRIMRGEEDGYGGEFSGDMLYGELQKLADLREEIMKSGNKIADKEGNSFDIFTQETDKKDGKTYWKINRDVLRDVRKGDFKSDDQVLRGIKIYVKKLNLPDNVRSFTYDEMALKEGEKESVMEQKYAQIARVAEAVRKGKPTKEALDLLRSDEKEPGFTSKSEFHNKALKIKRCAYIYADVLDVGVDVLLGYEKLCQKVDLSDENLTKEEAVEQFEELAKRAGDEETERLREFRKNTKAICEEYGFGLVGEKSLGAVGGDELTLAIDLDAISEDELNDLIFKIKEKNNARLIKINVAGSERDSSDKNQEETKAAHLEAMKHAEEGADILKKVEKVVRKINLRKDKDKARQAAEMLPGILKVRNGELVAAVAVVEGHGAMSVISQEEAGGDYQKSEYSLNFKDIKKILNELLGEK